MNMLNSIILEGDVCRVDELNPADKSLEFTIQVAREFKDEAGNCITEAPAFTIKASGTLAEYASDKLGIGRGIRVVGRLINDNGNVKVFAEHIEYKPEKKKGKKEA